MGEYNTKSKKKFIEITATQISEKLENFKNNFLKDWNQQVTTVVKEAWNKELVGKTVMGLSKEKFLGTVVPVKMKEQLTVSTESTQKEIITQETLYFVDRDGYLLDADRFYLLDAQNKEIRLSDDKIDILKREGLIFPASDEPSEEPTLTKCKSLV